MALRMNGLGRMRNSRIAVDEAQMSDAMRVVAKARGKPMTLECGIPSAEDDNVRPDNDLQNSGSKPVRSRSGKSRAGNELDGIPRRLPAGAGANPRATLIRWGKFNFVGGIGIAVQFLTLFFLKSGLHLPILIATAIAVEAAVLHNFVWHERFTWRDRQLGGGWWRRMVRFHLGNGAVSIAGNVALMKVLAGPLNYLVANAIAIGLCSIANFLVSECWVFGEA